VYQNVAVIVDLLQILLEPVSQNSFGVVDHSVSTIFSPHFY